MIHALVAFLYFVTHPSRWFIHEVPNFESPEINKLFVVQHDGSPFWLVESSGIKLNSAYDDDHPELVCTEVLATPIGNGLWHVEAKYRKQEAISI